MSAKDALFAFLEQERKRDEEIEQLARQKEDNERKDLECRKKAKRKRNTVNLRQEKQIKVNSPLSIYLHYENTNNKALLLLSEDFTTTEKLRDSVWMVLQDTFTKLEVPPTRIIGIKLEDDSVVLLHDLARCIRNVKEEALYEVVLGDEVNPEFLLEVINIRYNDLCSQRMLSHEVINRLHNRLMIDLSWSSCRIEGNILSRLETAAILNDDRQDRTDRDVVEIQNHIEALKYLEKYVVFGSKCNL